MARAKRSKGTTWKLVFIAILIFLIIFITMTDFDGDGLKNLDEINKGTSLLGSDTDGDGLEDGPEVNTYRTNPLQIDTDQDGLGDGEEVLGTLHVFELRQTPEVDGGYSFPWTLTHKIWNGEFFQTINTWQGNSWKWPSHESIFVDNGFVNLSSNPLSIDTDEDGLYDGEEYDLGTNAWRKDTDNDGLPDNFEIRGSKTIPIFYDSDGDLLGDVEEIGRYSTEPLDWDSDNDHLSDGIEVKGYDVDGDGMVDVDLPAFGANPLVKDIFVEVDWMPGARILGSFARTKLDTAFAEQGYVLHIDQGEFGGGTETEERVNMLYDSRPGPMNDLEEFKEKYFTPTREGTFYWCLMASDETLSGRRELGGFALGDSFTVAGTWRTEGQLGSVFMHELGHGLGLTDEIFDGIDSDKYSFSVYMSVMNYNSPLFEGSEYYDYSDGGIFNDWAHIDFIWLSGSNPKAPTQ